MPSKKGQKKQREPIALIKLDHRLQREIAGLLLFTIGIVTILAALSVTRGRLSSQWVLFLRRIFGWGIYPAALGMLGGGIFLLWPNLQQHIRVAPRQLFGLELALLSALGASHLLDSGSGALELAQAGRGGGHIGWALSYLLVSTLNKPLTLAILLVLTGVGVALSWPTEWRDARRRAVDILTRWRPKMSAAPPPASVYAPARDASVVVRRASEARVSESTSLSATVTPKSRPRRAQRRLPPLDLLNGGSSDSGGSADVRFRKQVIEETLLSFGVPAEVVEINQGPTVTQFGVEPGFVEYRRADGTSGRRKIRVSKIMALQDDLALALAASPIRIEAPVPGRSVVGIEVPNERPSMVDLRSLLESKVFRSINSPLRIALGRDVSGQPIAADLAAMPHLLIAGATGSGKSVCINSIVACLLLNNTPETLRLLMVDPKMVELTPFNGIPHLFAPVIVSAQESVRSLKWVTAQMDERYQTFSQAGVRNIQAYNDMATSRAQSALPHIVVVIDELADLMMAAPDEIERSICRIAQLARATGIHLVIATQRPSVDVVTGLIKANFPARISFAVTTQVDSRVILDAAGAEKLLGRGDMLYMSPESSKLIRMQGCFVSDQELQRLVQYWSDRTERFTAVPESATPWHGIDTQDSEDDLLDRAIELAQGRDSISISFLQRRLRIGYPRAARLVDIMEERGLLGPPAEAGHPREVLGAEESYELSE